MNSIDNLKELDSEIKYWEVEYENKLSKNKVESISKTISSIGNYLKNNDFYLKNIDSEIIASSVDCEILIKSQYDYTVELKKPRRIIIEKTKFPTKTKETFIVGLFNNSPLQKGNLDNLFKSYKNMNNVEIEIFEKQKSLKYFKEFVKEDNEEEFVEYSLTNLSNETESYIFQVLSELCKTVAK
jgi:hypothetical protein